MIWTHGAVNTGSGADSPTYISFGDTGSIDAFAWARISNPYTVFDSKQIFNEPTIYDTTENFPLFYDNQEISGSGTSTAYDNDKAKTTLSVAGTTAGVRVRQSKRYFNYQPGKSQLCIFTFADFDKVAGITKEIGLFDNNNGLFLRNDGTDISFVRRTYSSGSPVDNPVTQDNWNLNTLASLDVSKTQIFFLDFEWLGVGRVRFGFFIDGLPVYCHEMLHANVLTDVYMSTPNLPIRARIANDGSGVAADFSQICTSIISEGGVEQSGITRTGNVGAAVADAVTAATINVVYAVCGIRLQTWALGAQVDISSITMLETGNSNFLWRLHLNPTLTTGITYTNPTNGLVQFGRGVTTGDVITNNGIVLDSGYASRDISSVSTAVNAILKLGSLIDGTRDEFILSAAPMSANSKFYGSMTWREVW